MYFAENIILKGNLQFGNAENALTAFWQFHFSTSTTKRRGFEERNFPCKEFHRLVTNLVYHSLSAGESAETAAARIRHYRPKDAFLSHVLCLFGSALQLELA